MKCRMISIENTAISSFIDVDEEAWYADAIEAAVKAEAYRRYDRPV